MQTITAGQLINLSLKNAGILGVGQTAQPEDSNDAFVLLNMILAQWQVKRWLVYHLVDIQFQSTGALSYTVGPGQNFDVARPDRLEQARFQNPVAPPGYPVQFVCDLIESKEDYNAISVKQLGTWPSYAFYDSGFPVGNVYFWPVPTSTYLLFITVKAQLQSFTNLSDTINLPPEYYMALYYNLSVRLRQAYALQADPVAVALADESLAVIRGANTQVPTLRMPAGIVRRGGYNIFSDRGN